MKPTDTDRFAGAELVAIDEAAAIPLPIVRRLMDPSGEKGGKKGGSGGGNTEKRLTFLSSTINGYEGTGRALSLKLLKELREWRCGSGGAQAAARNAADGVVGTGSKKSEAKVLEKRWAAASAAAKGGSGREGGPLRELELSHPIRYTPGDPVET